MLSVSRVPLAVSTSDDQLQTIDRSEPTGHNRTLACIRAGEGFYCIERMVVWESFLKHGLLSLACIYDLNRFMIIDY